MVARYLVGSGSRPRRPRAPGLALVTVSVFSFVALGGACRSKGDRAPQTRAPQTVAAYDSRILPVLAQSGRGIPDGGGGDSGLRIPDAEAALFDEALCEAACAHIFGLVLAAQRDDLKDDPDALALFDVEVEKARPRRLRECVNDCRRFGTAAAVACVTAAKTPAELEACDL